MLRRRAENSKFQNPEWYCPKGFPTQMPPFCLYSSNLKNVLKNTMTPLSLEVEWGGVKSAIHDLHEV